MAFTGKVPPEVMLKRRKFSLASRCAMCFKEKEFVDHLFVHCQWDSSLRSLALSLMGITWVQPSNVKDMLAA